MQSVEIAGAGLPSAISEYFIATATNGRRSSGSLEQPATSNATAMGIVLYISGRPVGGVLATRPAGYARECDVLALVDRIGQSPEAAVRDFEIGAQHFATS
jgi:hypothetical protein